VCESARIPPGALLFRLNSWLADGFEGDGPPAPDVLQSSQQLAANGRATAVVEEVMLKTLDGLGRGEEGAVWRHVDSKRVVLAVTQLVLEAATRVLDERERVVRAREAALMAGGKFRTPLDRRSPQDAGQLRVAAKAAESLGRFAMSPEGARAICAQADIIKIMRSLSLIAGCSRGAARGSRLAMHMLLSHVDVCQELGERALKPPPPSAPARPYTVEEGIEVVDEVMSQLVLHLSGEGKEEEEDDAEAVVVEDCVGAVAGLAQCPAIVRHLETHPRLPLLLLRLVVVLASAQGGQADASAALAGLLAESPCTRDALDRVVQYLIRRMLGLSDLSLPVMIMSPTLETSPGTSRSLAPEPSPEGIIL
jgi:hypothetical protein